MGVVDELVRAREAYDRRDWVAAYDGLSDAAADELTRRRLRPARPPPPTSLGRHNDCIQALQRAYQAHLDAGDRAGRGRLRLLAGAGAADQRRDGGRRRLGRRAPAAARRGRRRRRRARLRARPPDVPPHLRRRVRRGRWTRPSRSPTTAAGSATPTWSHGPQRPGPDAALLRPGPRGARAARRGDGRRHRRRGLADLRRQRLLLADRGLPGDLRLRPGGRSGPTR